MYEKPRENLTQVAQFTRREGGTERKPSRKIFFGVLYRVAGEGYFTTFLKQNFENLKIWFAMESCLRIFELNRDMREV